MRFAAAVAVALAVSLPLFASSAPGQEIGVRTGAMWSTGDDLIRTTGVEGWVGPEEIGLVVGGGWHRGSRVRPEVLCSGLIPPRADCPREPTELRVRLRSLSVGYHFVFPMPEVDALRFGYTLRAGRVWVDTRRHGRVTERRPTQSESLPQLGVVVETEWRPWPSRPLRLMLAGEGTAAFGSETRCADCAPPSFRSGFSSLAMMLGLSFRFD